MARLLGKPARAVPWYPLGSEERRPNASPGAPGGGDAAHGLCPRPARNRVEEARRHVPGGFAGRDRLRPQRVRDRHGAGPDPGWPPRRGPPRGPGIAAVQRVQRLYEARGIRARELTHMRAAFYQGARTFTTGEMATPTPGPQEALLRVRRVGICGTDLHIFQGHLDHRVPKGGVICHETFGEIVAAPGASGFTRGDRVVVEPVVFCGSCRACRMGASYLCYQLKVLGADLPGGMREYWAVSTTRLLRVPDSITADHAPLTEPLPVNLCQMFASELVMHGSRLYARADWEEAIRLVASGAVPVAPLVSRRIPLESLQRGMEEALGGGPVMKVLVEV